MSRIPLDLYGEVTGAGDARYKWDANQPPGSRPMNLSFRTKIGEGFSDGGLQLPRRIDQDYPDLGLGQTVTFTGADGSIAYQGRIEAMPHDLSDRHTIGVTTAGWMAHAKDRKFSEAYADRDTGAFQGFPLDRRALLASGLIATGDFTISSEDGGLVCSLPNQALGTFTAADSWALYPGTVAIAKVQYRGASTSLPAGWQVNLRATDDLTVAGDTYTLTFDDTLRTQTLTTPRRYVGLQVYSNGNAATPAAGALVRATKWANYGSHGLTLRTGDTTEPDGVYASDVMRDIVTRWCPLLDPSGIQATDYVIQHLAFRDRTNPYDAFLELNKYHLWHLGVWDNRQLVYRPYDLTDYDWEIRTDDPGTTFSPQGPSTENLFNGIVVTYTDALTRRVESLTPEFNPSLSDFSTANPWNIVGVQHWDEITLSAPTLNADALALGVAALAERNRPKTPGTITVRGYIRDRAGNEQPCWKPRAGETIAVTNFPNDSPRLIVETDYDDETKTIRLAIDMPFALLDAYLDRQANALQAAGLA